MCQACQTALNPFGLMIEARNASQCDEEPREEPRCDRCGEFSEKLYRMGTGTEPMTLCGRCRSEFVGE